MVSVCLANVSIDVSILRALCNLWRRSDTFFSETSLYDASRTLDTVNQCRSITMIISKTLLQISLGGGSSDLPSYYQENGGFCITTAINKYIFIGLNATFDQSYSAGNLDHYSPANILIAC